MKRYEQKDFGKLREIKEGTKLRACLLSFGHAGIVDGVAHWEEGKLYICHDKPEFRGALCNNRKGYEYSWVLGSPDTYQWIDAKKKKVWKEFSKEEILKNPEYFEGKKAKTPNGGNGTLHIEKDKVFIRAPAHEIDAKDENEYWYSFTILNDCVKIKVKVKDEEPEKSITEKFLDYNPCEESLIALIRMKLPNLTKKDLAEVAKEHDKLPLSGNGWTDWITERDLIG